MNKKVRLLIGLLGGAVSLLALLFTTVSTPVAEGSLLQALNYPDQAVSADAAVLWMVANYQNRDGGYTEFSGGADTGPSDVGGTVDAILAIAATGYNPAIPFPGLSTGGQTPLNYLENNLSAVLAYANGTGGQAGKLVMAVAAMGKDPRNFQSFNLVSILASHNDGTGQLDSNPFNQSLAILGMAAVNEPLPSEAVDLLKVMQNTEGAWDDGFGTIDNVDATAMALMALTAAGEPFTTTAVISGTEFLLDAQTETAGWGYAPSFGGSNANSTGLAIQALSALGEDFYSPTSVWAISNTTPISALLSFQGESGAFQADFGNGPFDNYFATVQALVGVTGRPFPLPARYEAAKAAVACLAAIQDPVTAGWAQFGTGPANAGGTSRAIEALAAFGADLNDPTWTISSTTPIDALAGLAPEYMTDGGRVGVVMQGAFAAGEDVTDFAGANLPISITQSISPTSGAYAPINFGVQAHAEAMLALGLYAEPVDPAAVLLLQSTASTTGLWDSFDETGIALNVLSVLSATVPADTLNSLQAALLPTGGWEAFGAFSVNSTSEVVQGLYSAGEAPYSPGWSVVSNGRLTNSADVIMATQAENGCWQPFGGDDAFSTTDAILALLLDDVELVDSVLVNPTVTLNLPFIGLAE